MTIEFKTWRGKNLNYFSNSILGGPSGMKPFLMTAGFMIIPYVVFLVNTGKYITDELSVTVPIVDGIILFFIILYMAIATFIDAGIIPRNIIPGFYMDPRSARRSITHLGLVKKISKCETCYIIKPYRSSHCPDCDNCVMRFDHHCPWIGNCVGQRNYKYFFIFLSLMNIHCLYIIAFSVYFIVKKGNELSDFEKAQGVRLSIKFNLLYFHFR